MDFLPLNGLQHGGIGDAAERPDCRRPVHVLFSRHVLGEGGGDDDDVLGDGGEALDAKVDHAAENGVLRLEQLGDGKEAFRGLRGSDGLPRVDEEEDLGQGVGALAGVDGGVVELPENGSKRHA